MAEGTEGTALTDGAGDGGSAGLPSTEAADADAQTTEVEKTALSEGSDSRESGQEKPAEQTTETKEGDEGEKVEGAPEQYADFKVPDGAQVDDTAMTAFKDLAKGMNLTQEHAQKLVDFQADFLKNTFEAQMRQFNEMRQGWLKDSKADKEIGGQAFQGTVEGAKRALKQFDTEEQLYQLGEDYGFNNHPAFLRFLRRVDEAIGEDDVHVGGNKPGDGAGKSRAQQMFPDHPSSAQ